MTTIPPDWALYQIYLAGELVYDTFMSKIHRQPVKPMSVGLLDVNTCIALEQLANVLAVAYFNPGMHSRIYICAGRVTCKQFISKLTWLDTMNLWKNMNPDEARNESKLF
jgi:hypothetical protein